MAEMMAMVAMRQLWLRRLNDGNSDDGGSLVLLLWQCWRFGCGVVVALVLVAIGSKSDDEAMADGLPV